MTTRSFLKVATVSTLLVSVAACTNPFVMRNEFYSTVNGLRTSDAAIARKVHDVQKLYGQMHARFQQYEARVDQIEGRILMEVTAHFEFDDAKLQDKDKPVLNEVVDVLRGHNEKVRVTVQGFTDAAGDVRYNEWLGLERARSVAQYLVTEGGLPEDRVEVMSFGEDQSKMIKPGAWGVAGAENRRVALVIDYL